MDDERLYSFTMEVLARNEEEAKQMLIACIEDYIKDAKIETE